MSGEIIRLIPRPRHDHEQSDFPTIAFRSSAWPDDLAMDRPDSAGCECKRVRSARRTRGDGPAPEAGRRWRRVPRR
jgi:hypothetical protein